MPSKKEKIIETHLVALKDLVKKTFGLVRLIRFGGVQATTPPCRIFGDKFRFSFYYKIPLHTKIFQTYENLLTYDRITKDNH